MSDTAPPDGTLAWRRPDRRVAIITGAGAGAGAAMARAFSADGLRVVVSDVDYVLAGDIAAELRDLGGTALAHRCDVTSDEQVAGLFERAQREFGAPDIVVNNVGPRLGGEPLAHWARVLDANLQGTLRVTCRAIDAMRGRGGAVVNFAAAEALGLGPSTQPVFAAAKAGVIRFTAALAGLATECGVRVNCIAPDRIDSPEAIAALALTLAQREDCAGRVVLYRAGGVPELLVDVDAAYRVVEPF